MKRTLAIFLSVALLTTMLACAGCVEQPPVDTGATKESDPMETKPNETVPGATETDPTDPTVTTTVPTAPAATDPADTKPVQTDPADTVPTPTEPQPQGARVIPLCYPKEALKDLGDNYFKLGSFLARAAQGTSYQGNTHYDGTNLTVSPDFSATVEGTELPVYGTPVYVADGDCGALHSFASVDVDFGDRDYVTLKIQVDGSISIDSAEVFCHDKYDVNVKKQTITLKIYKHGVYTLVLNNDQDYALTLFVREYRDEDAEIAAYKAKYGAENVLVYEPGLHEISYLHLQKNSVLYLKAGAVLLPKHTFDIKDDNAAANTAEKNAQSCNGIGLNRFPVINTFASDNVTIAGRGTVDMTEMDWHERRGIVFTMCKNITMDGVILINPCEWAFITYRCENVTVTQSAVLGYRTNSDAFAICNTIGATITDCFARTGDDMFEVKTLGGVDGAVSRDITYRRCQAWGSKARCFGVIGEIEKDVSNILFEDGIVIFRDAIWDNNRIGSLVVLRETGNGVVDGITFRNITIHFDKGRPIQVGVYGSHLSGSKMQNILFENITYNAKMSGQLRLNSGAGNYLKVTFKDVTANGTELTQRNAADFIYCDAMGLMNVR
jgi:hypothetical protein